MERNDLTTPELLLDRLTDEPRREIDRWGVEQAQAKGGTRRPLSSDWQAADMLSIALSRMFEPKYDRGRPDDQDGSTRNTNQLWRRLLRKCDALLHRIDVIFAYRHVMCYSFAGVGAAQARYKRLNRHCTGTTRTFLCDLTLSILVIAIGLAVAGEARSEELTFKDQPADYWVPKLASGTVAEKRDAATAFAVIAPQREDVVKLLIEALQQRSDYELQTDAANALMRIGPFAAKAVPALVETLGAPDIEDNSVREQAASALAAIVVDAPIALTEKLEEASQEAVVHGLLRAIGYLRMSDDRTLVALFRVLDGRPDTADGLYEKVVWTLDRIGAPAVPAIIDQMNRTQNVVALAGFSESLGRIHMNLSDELPPHQVVRALLQASQRHDDRVVFRAIRAMQLADARTPEVAKRLREILRDDAAEPYIVGVAADAGADLFPQDDNIVQILAIRLKTRDPSYSADLIAALQQYGVRSVAPIKKLLLEEPTPDLRYGAARTFQNSKFASDEVVAALAPGLDEKDPEVVIATTEALAELAPASLILVPRLSLLAAHDREDVRSASLLTLGGLANYMLTNETNAVEIDGIKEAFASALALARNQSLGNVVDPETEVLSPLSNVISQLEQAWRAQVWFAAALISIVALGIILAVIASWRVRRRILLLLGRRWIVQIGQCEFESRVVASAEGIRVTLESREATSATFERILPPHSVPDEEFLKTYRSALEPTSRTRIEVDEGLFGRPWANILVGSWAGNDAGMAGQIALTSKAPSVTKHYNRVLRFRAISNSSGNGRFDRLPMAAAEASEIAEICERWGAQVSVKDNARIADLGTSLLDADIVHVTAHATFDRVVLADGDFTVDDLSLIDLSKSRCRLLILSACEAGNLTHASAFLWDLVRTGVNIIAATHPVHDVVCKVFFGEMYKALLPPARCRGSSFLGQFSSPRSPRTAGYSKSLLQMIIRALKPPSRRH